MNDYTIEIRFACTSNGHNKLYTIRAERHLFPTLTRRWGGAHWKAPLALVDTFSSLEELDRAIRYHIRRRLAHGYEVTQGKQWVDRFTSGDDAKQEKPGVAERHSAI